MKKEHCLESLDIETHPMTQMRGKSRKKLFIEFRWRQGAWGHVFCLSGNFWFS